MIALNPKLTCYDKFAYPFTVENHVLHPYPPYRSHADQRAQIQAEHEQQTAYLEARASDKEKRRKEILRKLAPGYSEGTLSNGGLMQPKRLSFTPTTQPATTSASPKPADSVVDNKPRTAMDDLAGM